MTDTMKEKLAKYLNDHHSVILETAGTKCCEMKYKPSCSNKAFNIAVAFCKDIHSTDPVEYIIGEYGYVIAVPGFWLAIPTCLSLPYIEYYIDKYMRENIFGNGSNSAGTNNPGTNNPAGCGCPNMVPAPPPIKPQCPTKPLEVNLHDDPNGQLNGYFIPDKQ